MSWSFSHRSIMTSRLRSILAATDLGNGSDAVVRSAGALAQCSGAELHLLHSLQLPWIPAKDAMRQTRVFEKKRAAEERLQAQVERTMPTGIVPRTRKVVPYVARKAISDYAEEISADLIVVGRHRGCALNARLLGTTADRIIRTAQVPCLVVSQPLNDRIRRIGVPLDVSDPSAGALEIALAWGLQMGGAQSEGESHLPEVRVMYAAWRGEKVEDPKVEQRVLLPELDRQLARAISRRPGADTLLVATDVRWDIRPSDAILRWARQQDIDLLVMGTHGRGGLERALVGTEAVAVARQATCPVLLVPPSLRSGRTQSPRLERVLLATDFSDASVEAARWSTRLLAPEADHRLVHVLEVPGPPATLAGRYGSPEQVVRSARLGATERLEQMCVSLTELHGGTVNVHHEVHEGRPAEQILRLADDVDLVVMGEHGRSEVKRGAWTMLGTTVERVLRASPAPVLVVRGAPRHPPRKLLVAFDGSKASMRALSWAVFLVHHFNGSLEVMYVETPHVYGCADMVCVDDEAAFVTEQHVGRREGLVHKRKIWMRDMIRGFGIDPDAISIRVGVGNPAAEVVAEQKRSGVELVVIGTHGHGALRQAFLGSVANAVLRTACCSVLVVGEPNQVGSR